MLVPALRELRRVLPTANITLVSKPGTADIFKYAGFLDEVLVYDRSRLTSKWNQIREWQRRKFEVAGPFPKVFSSGPNAILSRMPTALSYTHAARYMGA